ncbi:MAG TPA: hypothetical protein VGM19_09290 [Armatimonadota bacterium]|jgi:hypothetical protein
MRPLPVAHCLLLLTLVSGAVAQTPAPPAAPSVAVFTNIGQPLPLDDYLRAQGWQTLFLQWGQEFTAESFKPFNVIVLPSYPLINKDLPGNSELGLRPDYEEKVRKLLWDYVAAGGSLLVYGGDWPISKASVNPFLAKWGATLLNEQVLDPGHFWQQETGMQFKYYWTDNIAAHPVTKDVKTVYYPARTVYGAADNTLKLTPEWQVVVKGTADAVSRPLLMHQQDEIPDETKPGSYASAPPLAAVRQAGKGRVALFAWSSIQTLFEYGHYMVEDVYFTRGGGGRTSDGLRLLTQTLGWLAEPSRQDPALGVGGYVNQPNRPAPQIAPPIKWKGSYVGEEVFGARRWYKGIFGARTALTGGSGAVADYAAAAKAAGLDFIGFMEDFAQLTPAQWDKFRQECAAATTPELLVLPGQTYQRGPAGDWYFKISDSPYPQKDMLTPDGKRVANYLYDHFNTGLNTLGPYDVRREPSPIWVSRAYNSMAVVTTREGKSDVFLEPYLYQTGVQDEPKPVAIDLISSPAQVREAAGRYVNLYLCESQEELRKTLKNPDMGRPAQVSNGPVITTWQANNCWRSTYGRPIPGTERIMARLVATSDVPLKEAIIYDGTRVFRRYLLTGNKCDIVVNYLQDQQHQLVPVVYDTAGRLAVRKGQGNSDMFNRRFMCGDRQNSLTSSLDVDAAGNSVNPAAGAMINKFIYQDNGYPANAQIIGRVPWYWDGCPGGYVQGGITNGMWLKPLVTPQPPDTGQFLVQRMEFPLGSRDVLCQAQSAEAQIPVKGWYDGGFVPIVPLPEYRAYTRLFEFKKTPDGPSAALIEGSYTMLPDGKFEPHEWYWSQLSHIFYSLSGTVNARCNWAFVNPGEEYLSGAAPPKDRSADFIKTLQPGGFLAYTTAHESGAVFPLDQPITVVQNLNEANWFRVWLGYSKIGQTYRKGDVIPYRLVIFTGSVNTTADTREIEAFRQGFGLGAQPPAYTVQPRVGSVLSTQYVLELQAQNGGFGGVVTRAQLPTRLPIRVHGINPRWTCGIVEHTEKWWLPLGTLDDAAYAALDTRVDRDVWIGNVVTCDQPQLMLTLIPDGEGGYSIEAHNPTDQPLTANVRTVEEWTLSPPLSRQVTVPAGSSVMIEPAA